VATVRSRLKNLWGGELSPRDTACHLATTIVGAEGESL
jgi:hypothetical protein